MKCMSCEVEINPKWKHALENNICPMCGDSIMDLHLKELLSVLRQTLDQLTDYTEEVNDWMLSNYQYIKTTDEKLIDYLTPEHKAQLQTSPDLTVRKIKITTDKGEEEVEVKKIQSEEKTQSFFKRSGAVSKSGFSSPQEKTEHLRDLANKIKHGDSENPLLSSEKSNEEEINEAYAHLTDPNEISLDDVDEETALHNKVLLMNQSLKGTGDNKKDLLLLQNSELRRQESYEKFESGTAGKGSFSRSG